jgi:hypothetical protein
METNLVVMVTIIALLAGLVGGFLVISPAFGGAMMRLGQMMSPQMMKQQMMTPEMMIDMCRQMMADPALRTQMLEMHRQMHDMMKRR